MPDAPTPVATVRWRAHLGSDAPREPGLIHVRHAAEANVFACPLPSLGGDFDRESWRITGPLEQGHAEGWDYVAGRGMAFAALHIDDGEHIDRPEQIQQAAFDTYNQLFRLQRSLGLGQVQRIWHWLSNVTAGEGDDERYRRFCRGRAEALDGHDHGMPVLPPATLVSSHRRGLRMHALLADTAVVPIENPRQVSAYAYPRDYGERPPAFARGGRVQLGATSYLLISGTASIVGHESRHVGDVSAQAREALDNVRAVMRNADCWQADRDLGALECLKAYIRDPDHAGVVAEIAAAEAPGVPLALLHAPLCRPELLVEFEAQMPLP
ncbi:pteridine-dependent deoxygenase like protein [Salinisphaera sp. T5B8]|uniref:chorismate transformation enzyme, FkbO/Hyg5 family n=1 Tax=Salinisphaera sp. T5B8 TaxID=1304154 RepID=UPI0033422F8C